MNKKGFVVTSVLYPITILVTGVTAVFLSTTKTNNVINGMKLDVNSSVFDSVTCDCEAINKAIKTHSEKIKTIENTIEKVQTNIDSIRDYLNYGNAKASEILSGKTAIVQGSKVTGTMVSQASSGNVAKDTAWHYSNRIYFGLETGYYPSASYGGMTGVSERYITYESLASVIGLTADKIVAGQSILGIMGTARTDTSATATAADILAGCTAWVNGQKIIGNMIKRDAYTIATSVGYDGNQLSYRIPKGAYVQGTSMGYPEVYATNQQVRNAIGLNANTFLNTTTILGVSGNIPVRSVGETIARAQIIPWNNYLYYRNPEGYYPVNTGTGYSEVKASYSDVASAIGLTADKIKKGETILGITGTYEAPTTTCPSGGFTEYQNLEIQTNKGTESKKCLKSGSTTITSSTPTGYTGKSGTIILAVETHKANSTNQHEKWNLSNSDLTLETQWNSSISSGASNYNIHYYLYYPTSMKSVYTWTKGACSDSDIYSRYSVVYVKDKKLVPVNSSGSKLIETNLSTTYNKATADVKVGLGTNSKAIYRMFLFGADWSTIDYYTNKSRIEIYNDASVGNDRRLNTSFYYLQASTNSEFMPDKGGDSGFRYSYLDFIIE